MIFIASEWMPKIKVECVRIIFKCLFVNVTELIINTGLSGCPNG